MQGIHNVNTSSIERRFGLTSSQISIMFISHDLGQLLFVIPITYYGTFANQARILALSALSMTVGSFIMAVPHFSTGLYELGEQVSDQCHVNGGYTAVYGIGAGTE